MAREPIGKLNGIDGPTPAALGVCGRGAGAKKGICIAYTLARQEGMFCGISSGCNVAAAIKLAQAHPELEHIVTNIMPRRLNFSRWG